MVRDTYPNQIKDIQKALKILQNAYVTIGVHEGAGQYQGKDAPSVVEVALWQEYGTNKLPERSWLRASIDSNTPLINAWREEILNDVLSGKMDAEKALNAFGFRIQEMIRNYIKTSQIEPALPQKTVDRKRAAGVTPPNIPLYNTGLFLRSITYKVYL